MTTVVAAEAVENVTISKLVDVPEENLGKLFALP